MGPRNESDIVTILSGTENGKTLGTPIALLVRNQDQRKFDYATTDVAPRPGHADYTRCPHPPTAARMAARIQWLRAEEDSTGGVCTCAITGVPVGIRRPR